MSRWGEGHGFCTSRDTCAPLSRLQELLCNGVLVGVQDSSSDDFSNPFTDLHWSCCRGRLLWFLRDRRRRRAGSVGFGVGVAVDVRVGFGVQLCWENGVVLSLVWLSL